MVTDGLGVASYFLRGSSVPRLLHGAGRATSPGYGGILALWYPYMAGGMHSDKNERFF